MFSMLTASELAQLADCRDRIISWLEDPTIDTADKIPIVNLLQEKRFDVLRDAFYRELEFGTGGMRGVIGPGYNRINVYVVRRATQGLANYIKSLGTAPCLRGVAIAYDSRNCSELFAQEAAGVLSANGIVAYIFPTLNTTPCLSFAVRHLHCQAGICITASHNPPEYNGFKVYWENGGQIVPPQDKEILAEVSAIGSFSHVLHRSFAEGLKAGLIRYLPETIISSYYDAVLQSKLYPISENSLSIVFTPLHGTGGLHAQNILSAWGYHNVTIVAEQAKPDGSFPTVVKPNPEEPAALSLAIAQATKNGAQLVLATDPDADRLALAIHEPKYAKTLFAHQANGEFILLNGNQIATLLFDYIISAKEGLAQMPPKPALIKTIVTSGILDKIASAKGVDVFNTLTGFKYIGNLITTWEKERAADKKFDFLFAAEESFGFLAGSYVRDKDGVGMVGHCAELVSSLLANSISPLDRLLELYEQYGAWQEELITIDLPGEKGMLKMNELLSMFRHTPPEELGGFRLRHVVDYQLGVIHEETNKGRSSLKVDTGLPQANVLELNVHCFPDEKLRTEAHIFIRPSGTEPKIKFYISICVNNAESAAHGYHYAVEQVSSISKSIKDLCAAQTAEKP